jgi:phage protein D
MADAPRPRLTAARPSVAVGGRDDASLAHGLLDLRISESADGLSACEATFGNWGARGDRTTYLYFDRQLLDFGKELMVGVGTDPLFRGRITGLEARFPGGDAPQLTVLAEDRHQDLRMTRRTRTFVDVTDADVFSQVATDHGLRPDVRLTGPTYAVLAQLNQSDLAFLRERARTIDAELWMDGSTLVARARADRPAAPPLPLGYGNELREFTVLADLAGQRSAVTVSGWDVAAKERLTETADEAVLGAEVGGGTGGARALAAAFGRRAEHVVHSVPLTGQEARHRAETLYKRIGRRFLVGHGVAETSARLRLGAKVELTDLGGPFSGEYYVSAVTHRFDAETGLRTEFTAERAYLRMVHQ